MLGDEQRVESMFSGLDGDTDTIIMQQLQQAVGGDGVHIMMAVSTGQSLSETEQHSNDEEHIQRYIFSQSLGLSGDGAEHSGFPLSDYTDNLEVEAEATGHGNRANTCDPSADGSSMEFSCMPTVQVELTCALEDPGCNPSLPPVKAFSMK